jgi:hypothetical protein
MDPTLVFVLRLLLVAFGVAAALDLSRRVLGRSRRTVPPAGTSAWTFWRRAARIISLVGILGTIIGVATKEPTEAVIAAMAVAAGGFVMFVLFTALEWATGRRG